MNIFKTKRNILALSLVTAAVFFFSVTKIAGAYKAAGHLYPLIDDTWYKVLTLMREKTNPQTIINSWWDFGDWFKVIAKRRVIFDGQSQDTPQAYWMAKSILDHSEEEAIRILRMLNNGGNRAFEIMNEYIEDPLQAVLILENLLAADREETKRVLLEHLPAQAAENVLAILFNKPSPAVFVVEYTMVPKMPAISYLGNWDFSKVYIAQKFDSTEKERIIEHLKGLGRDSPDIQRFYQEAFLITTKKLDDWLSHRLRFYSDLVNGVEKDGIVFFANGYVFNPATKIFRSKAGHIPRSLFLYENNEIVEVAFQNPNVIFSGFVFRHPKEGYKCILLDRELGRSLFVRLYFLRGRGLRYFIPFVDVEERNKYIRVFGIAWDGKKEPADDGTGVETEHIVIEEEAEEEEITFDEKIPLSE